MSYRRTNDGGPLEVAPSTAGATGSRDLGRAEERIRELEDRCAALERHTPAAQQAQHEADLAAADLAESGYDRDPPIGADRHGSGCACPYCYDEAEPEPEDFESEGLEVEGSTAGATAARDHELMGWLGMEITKAKATMEWLGRLRQLADELNAIPGVTARVTICISGDEE